MIEMRWREAAADDRNPVAIVDDEADLYMVLQYRVVTHSGVQAYIDGVLETLDSETITQWIDVPIEEEEKENYSGCTWVDSGGGNIT